ncbi:MAG: CDGSH iron-sulfur domain-containing protein [Methyloceanibacter sp.]
MSEIRITKDGPYLVSGNLPLAQVTIGADAEGESVRWEWGRKYPDQAQYALCRCGGSARKPDCDGTHAKIGFKGTETASRKTYREQAKVMGGPTLSLTDAESLCAFARFCDPNGQVWTLVMETDHAEARKNFVRQTGDCPSGRLVAWDNATGEPVEPHYERSIGVIEDPVEACSGPLWGRGGVPLVGGDGVAYEVRNRVTLCRCGVSKNKPFCDGSHAAIKFKDGI